MQSEAVPAKAADGTASAAPEATHHLCMVAAPVILLESERENLKHSDRCWDIACSHVQSFCKQLVHRSLRASEASVVPGWGK